jgi:DNA-binding response OmpR family regulator
MAPNPQQRRTPTHRLRLLVADDDRDAVVTLSTVLENEGHEVIEVYRADAVLELARRYKPDVALLDIGMPGMTGFEVARKLRDQLGAQCPVLVAVTAWNQESAKVLGKLVGFKHYVVKPYSMDDLLDALMRLTAPRSI